MTKKYQPDSEFLHNKWQLPGLGMKNEETYAQTLERIQEAFAISFEIQTHEPIESISYRNKNGYTILHIFACKRIRHPGVASTTIRSQTKNLVIASEQRERGNHVEKKITSPQEYLPLRGGASFVIAMTGNKTLNDSSTWLSYEDINPSDCTPLTLEIIEIAQKT